MAGYFKTTKDFYRALWTWLEIQKSEPQMPKHFTMNQQYIHEFCRYNIIFKLGYVRQWPDMPELKEGYYLFCEAKKLAELDNADSLFQCRQTLEKLKTFMLEKGLNK